MTHRIAFRAGLLLAGVVGIGGGLLGGRAEAQAAPTARQSADIAVFAAGTGTLVELDNGKNAGITAGVDLGIKSAFGLRPGIDLRGTYPFDSGQVAGLKSVMIGPRVQRTFFRRYTPYVDGFFGRGSISYQGGGIVVNGFRYDRTTSNIYGGGGGVDVAVARHFDLRGDVQFERWSTPVVVDHRIYPIPISLGVVYHLDFNNRHPKRPKVKY